MCGIEFPQKNLLITFLLGHTALMSLPPLANKENYLNKKPTYIKLFTIQLQLLQVKTFLVTYIFIVISF